MEKAVELFDLVRAVRTKHYGGEQAVRTDLPWQPLTARTCHAQRH